MSTMEEKTSECTGGRHVEPVSQTTSINKVPTSKRLTSRRQGPTERSDGTGYAGTERNTTIYRKPRSVGDSFSFRKGDNNQPQPPNTLV
jgi:hypothetical protein